MIQGLNNNTHSFLIRQTFDFSTKFPTLYKLRTPPFKEDILHLTVLIKKYMIRTSLVVQRIWTANAGEAGSIPSLEEFPHATKQQNPCTITAESAL